MNKLGKDFELVSHHEQRVLPKDQLFKLVVAHGHTVLKEDDPDLPDAQHVFSDIIEI